MLIYRICFLSPCLYTCALIHVHASDILRPCCVLSRIPNPSTCTPALVALIDSHPSPSNDKQKARDHGTEGGPDPKLAAAQGSRFISFALSLRQMAISPLTFRRILLLDPLREQAEPPTMQGRNRPTGEP